MREGSLEAPTRHPIAWQDESFYDPAEVEKELERVFDICHGCRRCFNLCDSFPRLFDLIDASPTQELDGVDKKDFKSVVDACTLCDMCYMTKCPYVPPHPFNVDFPHLMLRHRAMEERQGKVPFVDRQVAATDRNGKLATMVAPLANWATSRDNKIVGPLVRKVADFHPDAELPTYASKTLVAQAKAAPAVNRNAPAFGRKAVIYATCFGNYNNPHVGTDLIAVLARNGVETETLQPRCCGMPLLEQGRIADVAANAREVAEALGPWIDKGYDVIALVPSCALMLKLEWRLILPNDPAIDKLARATFDISEYMVDIAKKEGLEPGYAACPRHSDRAHGVSCAGTEHGAKGGRDAASDPRGRREGDRALLGSRRFLGLQTRVFRCRDESRTPGRTSGGGERTGLVMSECPLAGVHIAQGMEKQTSDGPKPELVSHPVQVLARAYGIANG